MKKVNELVKLAQDEFRNKLLEINNEDGLTKERYRRFLNMQYHLTKGVQRHFMAIAGNITVARKKNLRKWLINFAQEEEFHFEIAKADLKELGFEPEEMPFDTKLWWLYFDSIIETNPFIRLGATCILENIADGSSDVLDTLIKKSSDFLNPKNLRFLTIHRHGPNLDHGNQVLGVLSDADLNEKELSDVEKGAEVGKILYMRFVHYIVTGKYIGN